MDGTVSSGGGRVGARAVGRRAAELVAPSGCVTGSARYLFLIRPGGDDNGGGGQVSVTQFEPADTARNEHCGGYERMNVFGVLLSNNYHC